MPTPTKSGHAAVNGVHYYYAVYGTGEPLLLLHGGLGQIEMFGPNLTKLAASRQVIGVDLQGHGRTPLGNREISLVDIGNDMAGVLEQLGYATVDVLGYSLGGGVAFHPEEFPRLLDQLGASMRKPYDRSADVKKLTMPVMLIFGDSDTFRLEHIVKFYQLLGGGLRDAGWQREHMSQNRLAILPNLTHYELGLAPQVVDTALPFLNGEGRASRVTASARAAASTNSP
jgi:pimeloyl-ACP methyl ester carboxylesterase